MKWNFQRDQAADQNQSPPREPLPARRAATGWLTWLRKLPQPNYGLAVGGLLLIGGGLALAVVPPTVEGTRIVLYPYTAGGRSETCSSNLRALALALEQYRQDSDGRYPPVEYSLANAGAKEGDAKTSKRVTWVMLLGQYDDRRGDFLCPASSVGAGEETLGGYGFNPALALRKANEVNDPAQVLLLVDRGKRHDLALLPPFASWLAPAGDIGSDGSVNAANFLESANFAFPHPNVNGDGGGSATVLYGDGHVESLAENAAAAAQGTSSLRDMAPWGGTLVMETALQRLLAQHPQLQNVAEGKSTGAAALQQAKSGVDEVLTLWTQNRSSRRFAVNEESGAATERCYSPDVEALGWSLGRVFATNGDADVLQKLRSMQSRQMDEELQRASSGAWQGGGEEGTFQLRYPAGWTADVQRDGRYVTTTFRSPLPDLLVLVERGERSKQATRDTVDWSGMEEEVKAQKGNRFYRRLDMSGARLGGVAASRWEFEVEKQDGQRLQKMYLGHVEPWRSFVLVGVAPAGEFSNWRPVFQKMADDFRIVDVP